MGVERILQVPQPCDQSSEIGVHVVDRSLRVGQTAQPHLVGNDAGLFASSLSGLMLRSPAGGRAFGGSGAASAARAALDAGETQLATPITTAATASASMAVRQRARSCRANTSMSGRGHGAGSRPWAEDGLARASSKTRSVVLLVSSIAAT